MYTKLRYPSQNWISLIVIGDLREKLLVVLVSDYVVLYDYFSFLTGQLFLCSADRHGWWTVTELLQRSRVHLAQVIRKELNGRAILRKLVPIATMSSITVMYISRFYSSIHN